MFRKNIFTVVSGLAMTFLFAVLLSVSLLSATAASVEPTYMAGNPRCSDIDASWTELKVDPPNSGTYSSDGKTVNVSVAKGGIYFDWTSSVPVAAVIVKGGPNANIYTYNGATGDSQLHSPTNPKNGKFYALSHMSFCYGESTPPPVCYDYYGNPIPCPVSGYARGL